MDTMGFSKLFTSTENSHIANENKLKNAQTGVLILTGRTDRYKWKTYLALVREVYLVFINSTQYQNISVVADSVSIN